MTIGDRIKYFREQKHMTQEELSKLLNTTKQTVYKYENNVITNIPSDKIERMANIFSVDPTVLMGWDPEFIRIEQEITKAEARNNFRNSEKIIDDRVDAVLREFLCLYARSKHSAQRTNFPDHPSFDVYVSMLLNQNYSKKRLPHDVYSHLVDRYGVTPGITEGNTYWKPMDLRATAPVYSAAAGEGLISDGTPDDEIKLHLEADQTVVKVVGHSMAPTLQDGDLVVFQAQSVIDYPRQICLVQINGNEPTIKRVEIKDDGVLLIGDNINVYTPHFYTAEEVHELPVTIEGVAVKMIRDFD